MLRDRLKQVLSLDEFVVDERPLPIMGMGQPPAVTVAEASGPVAAHQDPQPEPELNATAEEGPPAAGEPELPSVLQQDLLSQLMEMMVEQVKLTERARQLESRKVGDDEFGRFVRQVLPFLDNFSRLLEMAREYPPSEELDNWLKSVEALYFRIVNLLESYGLVFINSLGKSVDFDLHEVVDYRNTQDHPHNTVIKELQKGVVFRGRLMRDAKVVVACNQ